MCIRDRANLDRIVSEHLKNGRIVEDLIFHQGKPLNEAENPCLLYTSDAADERSSVDLGGRRIIKKKIIINGRLIIILYKTTDTQHKKQ